MMTQRKNLIAVKGLSEQKVEKIIAACKRATGTTLGAFKTGKLSYLSNQSLLLVHSSRSSSSQLTLTAPYPTSPQQPPK